MLAHTYKEAIEMACTETCIQYLFYFRQMADNSIVTNCVLDTPDTILELSLRLVKQLVFIFVFMHSPYKYKGVKTLLEKR